MSAERAACAEEDPALFDQHRYPEVERALSVCSTCGVTEECLTIVRPQRSSFDGVAGGQVWRNGYRVRRDNSTREDRLLAAQGSARG
jgi:hypothetical protein